MAQFIDDDTMKTMKQPFEAGALCHIAGCTQ